MQGPGRIGDLEISQDLAHERTEARLEAAGQGLMALVLLAALGGAFGTGPLSDAHAGNPRHGLGVEYERVQRYQAPYELRVALAPGANRLTIGREFLDAIELQHVSPEPKEVLGGGKGDTFIFNPASGGETWPVRFQYKPARRGRLDLQLTAGDQRSIHLDVFVLP
jgi:hypothetical protein